ncbi:MULTISPECIES: 3-hydroxyacyl-CoA dehydrogenase family protein [unclassified Streptomyces]|jgi:3-hydroxybutyryl-CoA dehydrogenase|uniref:3-hydroxyacyl-CoA dehydrogenase family protein n=1 Tax=unclassified Streptomyces TaxID=2593676 RepID=UPI0022569440|nr:MULTISPECIES: 3-hydroxyacyl-CoA dehydrogenase family protein [unclassified Streptomyces]MCX4409554.1 3-hydroxyacyl-CoA dehydrogenase family protein [Streptomyces sp. NBC_01764]MCX5191325.1 3-hydroxyacyl-CoA dehydrogenase family protein [Streptomyces sp. NBC_00268]
MTQRIRTVGVVGAGVMGTGLAQALAATGHQVVLVDRTEEILDTARRTVAQGLRFAPLLGSGPGEDRQTVLDRIHCTTDYEGLHDADFVIENVTEDWPTKREVYERIDQTCPPHCVFAANTSVIPITRIAAATARPDRVLGMHFMNPVPLKPMIEMIRGHHTTAATLDTASLLLQQMGKEHVVVQDSPGFVSNRVLMLTVNEAIYLLHEGVAGAAEIDQLFKSCFGHRMGPLETADLIGLDTILQSVEGLYQAFSDSKYRPCPLLTRMVDAGLLGRKSGQGFFSYATTSA